jgi:hypothetical protein
MKPEPNRGTAQLTGGVGTGKLPSKPQPDIEIQHLHSKVISQAYIIVGSPCSGKSTLTGLLAEQHQLQNYQQEISRQAKTYQYPVLKVDRSTSIRGMYNKACAILGFSSLDGSPDPSSGQTASLLIFEDRPNPQDS